MMRHFLLIPNIELQNANALSSPFTIGFPAMTGWLGAVHALQRKLQQRNFEVKLSKVAISCHNLELQTFKGVGDFVHSIIGTSNPLDKNGDRPSFIEEARCHLNVSLLVELEGLKDIDLSEFLETVQNLIFSMKFASGDVVSVQKCTVLNFSEDGDNGKQLNLILNKLMLGHVLVERRDLVVNGMQEGKDALESVLDYLKVNHTSTIGKEGEVVWTSKRKTHGWIVPIAVGFQGVSELSIVKNQRNSKTPHRFAESVITLGEFILPYRINNIDQLFWQYHADLEKDLYLCENSTSI